MKNADSPRFTNIFIMKFNAYPLPGLPSERDPKSLPYETKRVRTKTETNECKVVQSAHLKLYLRTHLVHDFSAF
jgi:hypothetical protein